MSGTQKFIFGLFALIVIAALVVFSVIMLRPQPTVVYTTTGSSDQSSGYMVPDQNKIPFAQSNTCGQYDIPFNGSEYIYGYLYPDTTMAGDGDIFINEEWITVHDSGSGEYTIVRNPTNLTIPYRTMYGAGCLVGTDQSTMVGGEIANPNHTDLVSVRDVLIVSETEIQTIYFDRNGRAFTP